MMEAPHPNGAPRSTSGLFSPPVFPSDPEKTRRARAAFVLGVSFLLASLFLTGSFIVVVPELIWRALYLTPLVVLTPCFLLMLRRGHVAVAGLGVLVTAWSVAIGMATSAGGVETPAVHYFVLLVVGAGLLFGRRGIALGLVAALVTVTGIFFAEVTHRLPPVLQPALALRAWLTFDVVLLLVMLYVNLALREKEDALVDAHREVEERRQVEIALRDSEERFRGLSQAAFEGLMIHEQGVIVDANAKFAALVGADSPADVIGKNGLQLLPLTPESRERIRQSMTAPVSEPYGVDLVRLDGTIMPAETQGREIVYRGRPARVVAMRDISLRRSAQEQERHRLAELEAINKLSTALRAAHAVDEILPILMDETLGVFDSPAGGIWLYQPDRDRIELVEARGWMDEIGPRVHPGEGGIRRQVFVAGQPFVTPEFRTDPVTSGLVRERIPAGWGGACVPIRSAEGVMGMLIVGCRLPRQIQPSEVRLLTTLAEIAGMAIHRMRLHERSLQAAAALAQAYETTLEGWVRALDLRDKETEDHTRRVTAMTVQLARAMGIPEADLEHIRRGALLHDIGKMGLPDAIVLKAGPLTGEEWEIMRRHPVYAYEFLSSIEFLRPALDIPYCHHERWNGGGYPRGLQGEEIPRSARIFAVVDVWDALCSNRRYRTRLPPEEALDYIRTNSGTHFEPRVVDEFVKLVTSGVPEDPGLGS